MYNDNDSNMRNKQMEINTCKILPFFEISRPHAWKMTPLFLISRIRASHWKKYPFFAKRVRAWCIHFGRECVCVCLCVCVCGGGGGGGVGGGGGGWGWGGGGSVYIRD